MTWIIFIIYLLLFSWLITRVRFVLKTGLPKKILVALFVLKVMAGVAYFGFHSLPQYKDRSDTRRLYQESLVQTQLLKKDPGAFVAGLFRHNYDSTGGLFSDRDSYWNDLKDASFAKLFALVNIFTASSYYSAILFFNFIFFIGLVAFFRLMDEIYPGKRYLLATVVFLLPSFLFWCSGIHKDGLIFSAIGLILFSYNRLLSSTHTAKHAVLLLCMLLVIFFLRNYLVPVMLVALLMGWITHRFPRRKMLVLALGFSVGVLVMFTGKYIHPALDVPRYISEKQQQFRDIDASSATMQRVVEPEFGSFLNALPAAVDLGFFRPHPTEKGWMAKMASAEIILFWIIFTACLLSWKRSVALPPVVIACWVFAFLALLTIGYTVVYSGAVVRYRSLLMPLILTPAIGGAVHLYYKKLYMR